MRRQTILQLVVPLLGLVTLFSLLAFDLPFFHQQTPLLQVSILFRDTDAAAWTATRQGMEQAAADLDAELRFLTLGEANSVMEQQELLLHEQEGGADAIILVPSDTALLSDAVKRVSSQATVITLESNMEKSGAAAYIGVDDEALGQALAQAAIHGVPEGEEVILLDSAPKYTGISQRLLVAAKTLEDANRRVFLCRPASGQTLVEALAATLGTRSALAVVAFEPTALEQAARCVQNTAPSTLVYGVGATGTIAAYLEQGKISSIAAQNEFATGYLAVEAACGFARDTAISPIQMEFSTIRQENMYDLDNQKRLFPVTR